MYLGRPRYLVHDRKFLFVELCMQHPTIRQPCQMSRAGQPGGPERPVIRAQALGRVPLNLHSLLNFETPCTCITHDFSYDVRPLKPYLQGHVHRTETET
jgi:hypothetical protein